MGTVSDTQALTRQQQQVANPQPQQAEARMLESVLLKGDLSAMTPTDRINYYNAVCKSLGLNPLTRPMDYINLQGKLTLYVKKDGTDQLRRQYGITITIMAREIIEDLYVVTARATMPNGRQDEAIGAVTIGGLKGEARANALMKAEAKAKRRVTLSICGLGWSDESEVDSIPGARRMVVDDNGEILGQDGGSQADADAVAQAKIAELQAKEEAARKVRGSFLPFDVLEKFGDMKKALGEATYYRILGANGYEKSSHIPNVDKARDIFREMQAEVKRMGETTDALPADEPAVTLFPVEDEPQAIDPGEDVKTTKGRKR